MGFAVSDIFNFRPPGTEGVGTCRGGTATCNAGTLAGLPLNPRANDVAFLTTFPYLAVPHRVP